MKVKNFVNGLPLRYSTILPSLILLSLSFSPNLLSNIHSLLELFEGLKLQALRCIFNSEVYGYYSSKILLVNFVPGATHATSSCTTSKLRSTSDLHLN